jgi:predicted MFS family arabinose efflux permease
MEELWQLVLLWGIVAGLGAGATPVLGAFVANRWFVARRGLALGVLANGVAAGQMVFLPVLMAVTVAAGWRGSSLLMASFAFALMLLVALWMRDDPSDIGLGPYGTSDRTSALPGLSSAESVVSGAVGVSSVMDAFRSPTFWLLCGCFFVCGVTANGLIGTHLIPHVIERGIPKLTAAATVGVMGGISFVGTLFSGWMVDRVDPRKVLAFVYALRGSTLFILPYVNDFSGLLVFAVIYGLDWFASGPGTVTITADTFGRRAVGRIYGWIFLSHQLGAASAAVIGGVIYMHFGEYNYAFMGGGIMGWLAAGLALSIRPKAHGSN